MFLSDRTSGGTTACRDYTVDYRAFAGRIQMPGMSGSTEACSRDAIDREHRFIEDFGLADEYSVHRAERSE